MKKIKILYSAVLFSLPIFIIGTASSLFAVYFLDYYEKFWGKSVSFQISLWFTIAYSVFGILFFWFGAKFKMSRQEKFAILNPYKSFMFGILQSGLIFLSLKSPIAPEIILLIVIVLMPWVLGMASCEYPLKNEGNQVKA